MVRFIALTKIETYYDMDKGDYVTKEKPWDVNPAVIGDMGWEIATTEYETDGTRISYLNSEYGIFVKETPAEIKKLIAATPTV